MGGTDYPPPPGGIVSFSTILRQTTSYLQINNDILDNPKPGNTLHIPQWFKYTTSWWASQQISDSSYGMAIQYLIDEKFLTIPFDQEASDSASSFL